MELKKEIKFHLKIKNFDDNKFLKINIYEGENEYTKNNKLISSEHINKDILINERKNYYYEILFQFILDSNNNLKIFILDSNIFIKKYECLNK